MLIVITLYNDFKFTITIGLAVFMLNIISVILRVMTTDITAQNIVTMEIQVLLILITVGFFLTTSYTSSKFNQIKMAKINNEKSKTSYLLNNILSISNHMADDVSIVSEQIHTLTTSIDQTLNSMSDVNNGTYECADAIQNQLLKTEEIQKHISNVQNASDVIEKDINDAVTTINQGQTHISS